MATLQSAIIIGRVGLVQHEMRVVRRSKSNELHKKVNVGEKKCVHKACSRQKGLKFLYHRNDPHIDSQQVAARVAHIFIVSSCRLFKGIHTSLLVSGSRTLHGCLDLPQQTSLSTQSTCAAVSVVGIEVRIRNVSRRRRWARK